MSKYLIKSNFTSGGKRYFKDNILDGELSKETLSKLLNYGLIESLGSSPELGNLEIDSKVEIIETPSSNEELKEIEETKNKKGNK